MRKKILRLFKKKKQYDFTHYLNSAGNWERTIYLQEDFNSVKIIYKKGKNNVVFLAIEPNGVQYVFKGKIINAK